MGEYPSISEMGEALQRSGYLMEQEVATVLEDRGYLVHTNCAFKDPDEGRSREYDVSAVTEVYRNDAYNTRVLVELVCECKNNTYPMVFLTRGKNSTDRSAVPNQYVFPVSSFEKRVSEEGQAIRYESRPAFFHLGLDKSHYDYVTSSKAVQFCRIVRYKDKWTAEHGSIYNKLFMPVAKAFHTRAQAVRQNRNKSRPRVWLFFPIVVVQGPLLALDSEAPGASPVEVPFVTFHRELHDASLRGRYCVDFVRQSHLESYLNDAVQPFVDEVVRVVDSAPADLVRQYS